MRLVAIFITSKTRHQKLGTTMVRATDIRGGNLGNKVTKTFPLFFSKLNRTA
jgi:hypothetical protein